MVFDARITVPVSGSRFVQVRHVAEVQDPGDGTCRDAHASGDPLRASTLLTTQPQDLVLDLE